MDTATVMAKLEAAEVPCGPIYTIDQTFADPQVQLSVSSVKGKMVQVVGGRDLRPLYSCIKLKETWLGETQVVPVRGTARDAGALPIARAGIAELLNF